MHKGRHLTFDKTREEKKAGRGDKEKEEEEKEDTDGWKKKRGTQGNTMERTKEWVKGGVGGGGGIISVSAVQLLSPIKITGKKNHKYYLKFFSLLWIYNLKILTWILYTAVATH